MKSCTSVEYTALTNLPGPPVINDATSVKISSTGSWLSMVSSSNVHVVMPAAAIDPEKRRWNTKTSKANTAYLFNHKALAKVFRAKLLAGIREVGLELLACFPKAWVVDVKAVGSGEKALVYLGRYLYKGVIQEKDIIACKDGLVTFCLPRQQD
jgi:Putative transposase